MAWRNWLFGAAAVIGLAGCGRDPSPSGGATTATASSAAPAPPAVASGAPSAAPASAQRAPISRAEFARLFTALSEPDHYFFSDNYISNETSYLQVVPELEKRARKHGAYIGVGPEQNFTYIAETEPDLAFILDIRRGNALEHLLYKAIFDLAESRSQFLALLVGRDDDPKSAPSKDADLGAMLAYIDRLPIDDKTFARIHRKLVDRIRDDYGIALDAKDVETLHGTHHAFFDKGLDLRFELHEKNGRKYPNLRELLTKKDPNDATSGFLGSRAAYERVRTLERENRVIPVVGDFAGDHALSAVGKELRRRDLPVSVFYVSNVEQYLMEPDKWKAWMRNVDALPSNEQSLFVRCYLDQGKRHPKQLPGHRTATITMSFDHFKWRTRSRGYGSFYQLATDSG
jgi:hypothetical protein